MMEIRSLCATARTLTATLSIAAVIMLSAVLRGNDPRQAKSLDAVVQDRLLAMMPTGTGGSAAMRAQRAAFWQQFLARKKWFIAGKGTLDVLLEAERFLSDSDGECSATPRERVAHAQAHSARMREIREIETQRRASR